MADCYQIKITTPQFRLVYHIDDASQVVTLLAVATRDDVYRELQSRLS